MLIVAGYLPAAVAFGVAARGAGLGLSEALVMSLIVYSGASQFAIVGLVAAGASWLVAAAVALVLGARHVLYGPALAPHLRRMSPVRAAVAAFGLTDEVFAVASVELRGRVVGFAWLLGLGAGAYASWVLGTWAGATAGAVIVDTVPSLAPALSFALPALFVALLVSLDLDEEERELFGKTKRYKPIFQELVDEGIVSGEPGGGYPLENLHDVAMHGDNGWSVWSP